MDGQKLKIQSIKSATCIMMWFLISCGVLCCEDVALAATTYESGDYQYTILSDGTAQLTKYTGSATSVTVPSTIDGYEVSTLYYTFHNNDIVEDVVISEGITTLSYYTFRDCASLKEIKMPDSLTTISSDAFFNCDALVEITIPKKVSTIRTSALRRCSNLTQIEVDSENAMFCSKDGVLFSKDMTSLICYPGGKTETSYNIPDGVVTIEDYSFEYGRLNTITFSDTVQSIQEYAFESSELVTFVLSDNLEVIEDSAFRYCTNVEKINIPSSVITIEEGAFEYCWSLESITVGEDSTNFVSVDGVLFDYSMTKLIEYPAAKTATAYEVPKGVTRICDYALDSVGLVSSGLTSIQLPETLLEIGMGAFGDAEDLCQITIPDSVTRIGNFAFSGCEDLETVILSNHITTISGQLFQGCNKLTSITIPTGVTSIEFSSFEECSNLQNITIPSTVTSISTSAFTDCSTTLQISTIEGSYAAQYASDNGITCSYVATISPSTDFTYEELEDGTLKITGYTGSDTVVVIPQTIDSMSVTQLGNSIFSNNSTVTSIYIPEGITTIGTYVFSKCVALEQITLPTTLQSIGMYSFRECTSLKQITLPQNLTELGSGAFAFCTGITHIAIPDKITALYSHTFYECTGLETIDLPAQLTSIGDSYTFYYCNRLKELDIPSGVTIIDVCTFEGCTDLASVTIPDTVTSIGCRAFYDCESLAEIQFPDKLESIGGSAFQGCITLSEISISNSVSEIGRCAFVACTNLKKITLPEKLTAINDSLFYQCYSLESLDVPDGVTSIDAEAFVQCGNLGNVTIPASVTSIATDAFKSRNGALGESLKIYTVSTAYATEYAIANGIPYVLTDKQEEDTTTEQGTTEQESTEESPKEDPTEEENEIKTFGEYTYENYEDGNGSYCMIVSYTGTDQVVDIPDTIDEKPVKVIGASAFANCRNLLDVYIPETVSEIGERAFYNCTALERVIMPFYIYSFSVVDDAFSGCSSQLTFVGDVDTASDLMSFIEEKGYAYVSYTEAGLNQYRYYTLDDGTIRFEGFYIRDEKERSQLVIPDTIEGKVVTIINDVYIESYDYENQVDYTVSIPHTVHTITEDAMLGSASVYIVSMANPYYRVSNGAIYDADMKTLVYVFRTDATSYTIADGVTSIRTAALDSINVTKITLPSSLSVLPNGALNNCYSLSFIEVSSGNTYFTSGDGVLFSKDMTTLICYPRAKSDTSYIIPDGVTKIGTKAFENSTLKTITLPEGLTEVEDYVFRNCTALTSLVFPETVTTIGEGAMYDCDSLKSVTLPSGLKTVSPYMFYYTSSLKELSLPEGITSIGKDAFWSSGITSLVLPDGMTSIDDYAFQRSKIKSIELPDGITSIGAYAFESSSLTTIELPDSVTSIGTYAFDDSALTMIELPNGVTSIGSNAFSYCKSLEYISLPKKLKTIPQWMCAQCPKLASIIIPDSVTSISSYAFYQCTALSNVVIPANVTTIGSSVFYNCNSALVLYVEEGSKAESYAIDNNITYAYITETETNSDYEYETLANGTLRITKYVGVEANITIPSQIEGSIVTEIGDSVFAGNTKITDVSLPNSIVKLGTKVFSNCTSLKTITCPDSISSMGTEVFSGCTKLTTVKLPSSLTGLSANTFQGCSNLTDVTLGSKVTSIGKYAFSGCIALETMELPTSVTTLGEYAFADCTSLKIMELSESVDTLGKYAFSGCSGLESITIMDKWMWSIPINAFEGCTNLSEIIVNDENTRFKSIEGILCQGTTLYYCPMGLLNGTFEIPSGITSISTGAFGGSKTLTSITIPSCVKSIASDTFANCDALEKFIVAEGNEYFTAVDGVLLNKDKTQIKAYPCGKKGNYIIPDSITSLSTSNFAGSKGLTGITIPEGITTLPVSLFADCSALSKVEIASTVTTLKANVFSGCTALETLYIPLSVNNIDAAAFTGCSEKLVLVVERGSYAESFARQKGISFEYPYVGISSLTLNQTTLALAEGDMQILKATILPMDATNQQVLWSSSDDTIATVSEDGVVKALKAGIVTITATVKNENVTATCEITIAEGEKEQIIVPGQENVNVGTQVEDAGMTYKVTSLDRLNVSCVGVVDTTMKDVVIPDTISINGVDYKVTTIVKNAFKGNKTLQSIVIGKEVTTIEEQAFYNCKSLKKITFKTKKLTAVGKKAFKGVPKKAKYSTPSGKGSLYKSMVSSSVKGTVKVSSKGLYQITNTKKKTAAFVRPESDKAKSITVVATVAIDGKKYKVTAVADNAFKNQKKLTKITIGSNVITIGKDAFTGCKKLKNLAIKSKKIKTVKKSKPGTGGVINFTSPVGTEEKYRKLFGEAFKK